MLRNTKLDRAGSSLGMSVNTEYLGTDGCHLYAAGISAQRPGMGSPNAILMHGGGPDHHSLLPLASRLADVTEVILPDVRGYGRSVCTEPARHTWAQYTRDVISLMDTLGIENAIVGGAGLGGTIALRAGLAYPHRIAAVIVIGAEDIEDDAAKKEEIAFMDAFAKLVEEEGIEAAWAPILPQLSPVIGAMVREAIPRSDPASIAAAAAIGRDRSFASLEELRGISAPALVIPGMDWRHPPALAKQLAAVLPEGRLASTGMSEDMVDAEQFAEVVAPAIRSFILDLAASSR